jgi:hypothetical protein
MDIFVRHSRIMWGRNLRQCWDHPSVDAAGDVAIAGSETPCSVVQSTSRSWRRYGRRCARTSSANSRCDTHIEHASSGIQDGKICWRRQVLPELQVVRKSTSIVAKYLVSTIHDSRILRSTSSATCCWCVQQRRTGTALGHLGKSRPLSRNAADWLSEECCSLAWDRWCGGTRVFQNSPRSSLMVTAAIAIPAQPRPRRFSSSHHA